MIVNRTFSHHLLLLFDAFEGNHSVLQLDLRIRRSVGYYLLQGYIQASLLVILSWISFWIDSEATADRVYIGMFVSNVHI